MIRDHKSYEPQEYQTSTIIIRASGPCQMDIFTFSWGIVL